MLSNSGHMGWARKVGAASPTWLPDGVVCDAIAGSWSKTYDGAAVTRDAPSIDGVVLEPQGGSVRIRSTITDPSVTIRNPIDPMREIDFVSLRIRLLTPDMETLQIFWIGADDRNFHETRSSRCAVSVRRRAGAFLLVPRLRARPDHQLVSFGPG